jgi:chemotaxis protein methyltransferase CheR
MPVPDDIVAKVGRRLAEHAGLELPAWVLSSRIEARLDSTGMDAQGYLGLVNSPHGRGELHLLVEAVRVGETRFFRHAAQVQALVEVVVPAWRARGRRTFRAWSAGCATGEEPYTLALVLARLVPRGALSIVATDVSEEALAVARTARYPASTLAHVPADRQDGLVADGRDGVRVRPDVAALVTFQRHNLVDDEAPRGFDLVWCRNVLIYFGAAARAHAARHLVAACEPGGFVFVGYSESLREIPELDAVRAGDAVIYRRLTADEAQARPRTPSQPPAVVPAVLPFRRTPPAGVPVQVAPSSSSSTRVPAAPRPALAGAPVAPASDLVTRGPDDRFALRGRCDDPRALAADLGRALARPGIGQLVVELDEAELIADEIAPVLRRARAAGEASGVAVRFAAARPGALRWLRRHRLEDAP